MLTVVCSQPQKAHSEQGKTLVYDPQLHFHKEVLKKGQVWKEIWELLGGYE